VSPQTLSYIENGKSDVTITKLEQIAKALEINMLELFSRITYVDPLAERKQVLEDTSIRLLNMYNDLRQKFYSEEHLRQQMDTVAGMQEQIVSLLKIVIENTQKNTGDTNTHLS